MMDAKNSVPTEAAWSSSASDALYGVSNWGMGLFGIDAAGRLCVKSAFGAEETSVPLPEIIAGIEQRGHPMPVLLRVENFLDTRIAYLHNTFRAAIEARDYRGQYRGVFPVKVNQQCQVIEEITRFGAPYGHGLEAGSKAELVLALANMSRQGLLILNGYKDREFIDLGLWAHKLGYRCFFVVESPQELDLLIECSAAMKVRPHIGARIKVSAKVSGMWTETSGDRSSFGLSSVQLLNMVHTLRAHKMLDCLELLHCHLGSQIPRLDDIRAGINEACRYYASLVKAGAPMGYLDVGGGLAVDYSGMCNGEEYSRDYDMEQYCDAVVVCIKNVLDPLKISHPHIVTESGRATVAHASMLLFNVIDVMRFDSADSAVTESALQQYATVLRPLRELIAEAQGASQGGASLYARALEERDAVRQAFQEGEINLEARAAAEEMFLTLAHQVLRQGEGSGLTPEEFQRLHESLADIYYANMSVFQSLPDTWAIGQKFPVVPLQRLHQKPERNAIIADLTCDCDGNLDSFILAGGEQSTLPLHQLQKGEDYYLGVFMIGAYQETLGDIHNLFGDTHVISIRLNADGSFDIRKEISGDTIADVLGYVHYKPDELFEKMRSSAEAGVKNAQISLRERQEFLRQFSSALDGYTYYR
ncbi:MAG: biosynthetic arginine decarboxylase [Desulfuromonadaceae bacterium]|nr:biosynthetic arginine decarboxylase [Desulfuromonas sp.]MDY0185085.1 biosynthetic arginine decarboxylase [Desulfuromonadaceae bacterium]